MVAETFERNESRLSPRFVPKERLSMVLASDRSTRVRGDVRDLSEVGARVLTNAALDFGRSVAFDVRSGYSFLFRAEGRIVWRSDVEARTSSPSCQHGILFTELSPFSRKLIRRLGGLVAAAQTPPVSAEAPRDGAAAHANPDLEALFPPSPRPLAAGEDRFDLLSDPVVERGLYGEPVECPDAVAAPPEARLSGSLGYFNNADVLQMLEATRATGVLYIEGESSGEVHLENGRICGCFSQRLSEHEAAFRLIVANRGRFRFVPSAVRSNLRRSRTTTQFLLEAQLRRDKQR